MKNPKGLYAGAIYLALKLKNIKISQKEIVKVVGITEVAFRARYKNIMNSISPI
jgi:transcription initiation factor TFIIIB Brf1 subunit/transcription initiation factor TFIIB